MWSLISLPSFPNPLPLHHPHLYPNYDHNLLIRLSFSTLSLLLSVFPAIFLCPTDHIDSAKTYTESTPSSSTHAPNWPKLFFFQPLSAPWKLEKNITACLFKVIVESCEKAYFGAI